MISGDKELSPVALYAEIKSAEAVRDERLKWSSQLSRYTGPFFKGDEGGCYDPENHEFELISLVLPRLIFDNPRVRVKSRVGGPQEQVATAMQHGLNRWIRDVDFRQTLIQVLTDAMFRWGVTVTSLAPDSRRKEVPSVMLPNGKKTYGGQPYRPVVKRLSPKRVFWDPLAIEWDETEFIGHRWVRSKADLIAEAETNLQDGWDIAAIKALPVGVDAEALGRDKESEAHERDEIDGFEVWCRHASNQEDGYNGVIYTLAVAHVGGESRAAFIKEPKDWHGHPDGPYTLYGFYGVPDETHPLSTLTATKLQADAVNAHARAVDTSAERRKKIAILEALDSDAAQKLKDAQDGEAIPLVGIDKAKVIELTLGGADAEQIAALQLQRERLDRNSGIFEAQRGSVTGVATATENAIGAESSATRIGFQKQRATDCAERNLEKVAYQLYHQESVVFPIGGDDSDQGAMPESQWFHGGDYDDDKSFTYWDLELEVEPYSMERTSEAVQQRRMMESVQLATVIAPALVMNPHVDAKLLMSILADGSNMPELRKLIKLPILELMQAITLQGMLMPQQPDAVGQPKLSADFPGGKGVGGAGGPPRKLSAAQTGFASKGTQYKASGPSGSGQKKPAMAGAR